ncbi:MAG: glycosyltransferase family 2 protein [Candidatus Binatia bacterium]
MTVVIPNWNGKDLLRPCLMSLFGQEFEDFETIVVDNGSTDGSVPFLKEHFPQVKVIRFHENKGFSAAVNAGILASETPYIALLNNDTEVHPFWLKELVVALETDRNAGSAMSKILFFSDPDSVNSAGDEFSWFGVAYQRRLKPGDSPLFNELRYVFSACAAAALYRKELFESVGLFDETFFAYQEDVDLGFRAQLAGYRCAFVPKAIVYHKYQMTSSRVSNLRVYLNERNKYFVLIKNLPIRLLILCFPLITLHEGLCFMKAIIRGYLGTYLRALRDVVIHLSGVVQIRRGIQAHRTVSDAYLLGVMSFREPFRIFLYRIGAPLL